MNKGSGRSIEQYPMYEELVKCRQYLDKFGGHPMAAGLSMQEAAVDDFRRALNANARLTAEDFIPKVAIDVAMPFEYVTEQQITELSYLEPFRRSQREAPVCPEGRGGVQRPGAGEEPQRPAAVLTEPLQFPSGGCGILCRPGWMYAYVRQKFGDVRGGEDVSGRRMRCGFLWSIIPRSTRTGEKKTSRSW